MTKKEQIYLTFTALFGPLGLFFISKAGSVTLGLFAIILGQLFYNDLGYIPIIWGIIIIALSLVWGVSAIKNKNNGLYNPFVIDIYKTEDKDYKYIINMLFGIVQFAALFGLIAFIYKITVNGG